VFDHKVMDKPFDPIATQRIQLTQPLDQGLRVNALVLLTDRA
jgi:hypothetical protein